MLYVVSGFMRTGTSMMMKALEAGGLDAAYRQSRELMRRRFADTHYDPNVGGLYELARADYMAPDFPAKYNGRLIKALNSGVPAMNVMPSGIRVVFMRRDAEEIRQSYLAFFGQDLPMGNFQPRMERVLAVIRNRRDVVSCHEFWFRDVVADPAGHFAVLAEAGWPIAPAACAAVVDPGCCRYRREHLEEGIV
jgi:hypothetical protein